VLANNTWTTPNYQTTIDERNKLKTVFCSNLLSGEIRIGKAKAIADGALTLINIGLSLACQIARNKATQQTSCAIRKATKKTLLKIGHRVAWFLKQFEGPDIVFLPQ
jgi:hypothetical protein